MTLDVTADDVHVALTALAVPAIERTGDRLYREFLAGRSPNTLTAYGKDLLAFAGWCGVPTGGAALSVLVALPAGEGNSKLLSWRAAMKDVGLAPSTINRRLSAVRSALRFARTIGATAWVPEVQGLKAQTYRDTRGPGISGTRALLGSAMTKGNGKAARDIAIIRVMFDLGLRRGEVANLDVNDVDLTGRVLWVLGKGRSQKEARTLPGPTLAAIHAWLDERSRISGLAEPALFVNVSRYHRGQRITGHGVYYVIRELGDVAGIRARPHGLRHASITAALDNTNGDVRAAQAHARHTNPQTTMRYDDARQDLAGRVSAGIARTLTLPVNGEAKEGAAHD
jgi:integrase/recombinase XerC